MPLCGHPGSGPYRPYPCVWRSNSPRTPGAAGEPVTTLAEPDHFHAAPLAAEFCLRTS